jgi:L-lactate utilization protein LutB
MQSDKEKFEELKRHIIRHLSSCLKQIEKTKTKRGLLFKIDNLNLESFEWVLTLDHKRAYGGDGESL